MNHLYKHDLPADIAWGEVVAVDTEAMGLDGRRDRLCLVQLSNGDGNAHLVQIVPPRLGGRGRIALISRRCWPIVMWSS
jgi:ribonuclease D